MIQQSATLNTAKSMKVVWNMSVTKPKSTRSIRLPIPPASTRAAENSPTRLLKKPLTRRAHMPSTTTVEVRVSTQVWERSMEKAAPVF